MASNNSIDSGTFPSLDLSKGGTNANLTASNGGIFYSTGTAGAILSGTATANKILVSGASTTPAWTSKISDNGSYLYIGTSTGAAGLFNTGVGISALSAASSVVHCTAIGYTALAAETNAANNTAVGSTAMASSNGSGSNSAFGFAALTTLVTGTNNCAFGDSSLKLATGSSNCAFGYRSGWKITTGTQNCLIGTSAAGGISGNFSNGTAVGYQALLENTGNDNTAVGNTSLKANTSGTQNTAVGAGASATIDTNGNTTSVGYNALTLNTGAGNTAVGSTAGAARATYTNSTFLGFGADASANSLSNATAIGYNASVGVSNAIVLGQTATATNVGIGTGSPSNILHIVGTFQQKGITSNWTNTDCYMGQVSVQTTNATPANVFSVAVGTTNDPCMICTVWICCENSAGSSAAYGTSTTAAWYNGTTTANVSTAPTITMTNSGSFTVAAAWAISSNNLVLQVTGIAATTINWVVRYQYHRSTNSTS
jgi:hypothetical protein